MNTQCVHFKNFFIFVKILGFFENLGLGIRDGSGKVYGFQFVFNNNRLFN